MLRSRHRNPCLHLEQPGEESRHDNGASGRSGNELPWKQTSRKRKNRTRKLTEKVQFHYSTNVRLFMCTVRGQRITSMKVQGMEGWGGGGGGGGQRGAWRPH